MVTKPSGARVKRHREHLRERGLRPIQIWLPDTRAPHFAAEAHRQSLAVNAADEQDGVMQWIADVSVFYDDDAEG